MPNPFSGLTSLPKAMKRFFTGREISRREMPISFGATTMRLVLKEDRSSGERYAVLGLLSSGNYQYALLSAEDIASAAALFHELQGDLDRL